MITVGNGHKAPAEAIAAEIETLYPKKFEIEVPDFTNEVGDHILDKRHKASWDWMLSHPKITFAGQKLLDNFIPAKITRVTQRITLNEHAKNAAEYLKEKNFDLLVATHFQNIHALAIAKKKSAINTPLVGITTDPFDANAMWAQPNVNEMIVSSNIAKQKLIRHGVAAEKISIFGYPLGKQFIEIDKSKAEARSELGLDPVQLTILQSAGGEGIGGQLEGFVEAVLEANLDVQYVIACGRNTDLQNRLKEKAIQYNGKTKILPQGFINNMATWITASDLVLGKAGAASTFEPLSLGRPIFHTSYASFNEKTNIDWCLEQGIGKYIPEPSQLVAVLKKYLANKTELVDLEKKIAELNIKPGTLDIAKHLIETYLKSRG